MENSLDENLDWQSLQLETLSHPYRVEIVDGNMVSFIFEEIYLPDSTSNEPASHGFIAYKIKPISDIIIGDVILNKADIYFDFNLPIETNTVSTTIVAAPDDIPPTALCQDAILVLDAIGMATLNATNIDGGSTDNIEIASLMAVPNMFSCAEVGTMDVLLIVEDLSGNTDTCTSILEVRDEEAPSVLTQDITVDLNSSSSVNITVDQIDNGSYDNCGIAQMSLDQTTFTEEGAYIITLSVEDVNNNLASNTATVNIVNTVSTENVLFTKNLVISPNPVRNILNIAVEGEVISHVHIYSESGKRLLSDNQTTIDASVLASGIYMVEIISQSGKKGVKWIVKY